MTSAPNLSTLELMEVHINTLFCFNAEGRLAAVNEIGEPPAPFFYMGRTQEGNFWRFRHDLPATLIDELERLCRTEPVATDLAHPPQNYAAMRAAIGKYLPLAQQKEYRGPAYWIPEVKQSEEDSGRLVPAREGDAGAPRISTAANVVLISESNSKLVQKTFPWLIPLLLDKDVGPVAAAVVRGKAVCLCFCSRRPAQATEAGVETLPEYRGKGYATSTVAAWAAEVSRLGCIPLYGTSWDNLASQAVARKLGMVRYGEDWSIQS
jgi:hypothetical protein